MSCRTRSGIQKNKDLKKQWIPGQARNDEHFETLKPQLRHSLIRRSKIPIHRRMTAFGVFNR